LPNFDLLGALEIRGMKCCDFYCKRYILAWIYVIWTILPFAWRSVEGSDPHNRHRKKVRKSRTPGHSNEMSPL